MRCSRSQINARLAPDWQTGRRPTDALRRLMIVERVERQCINSDDVGCARFLVDYVDWRARIRTRSPNSAGPRDAPYLLGRLDADAAVTVIGASRSGVSLSKCVCTIIDFYGSLNGTVHSDHSPSCQATRLQTLGSYDSRSHALAAQAFSLL